MAEVLNTSFPGPAEIREQLGEATMVLPLQTVGMSPFSAPSSIWKHTPCHNVATIAHQGAQATGNTQPLLPARSPGLLIHGPFLLGFDLTMIEEHGVLLDPATNPRASSGVNQPASPDHTRPFRHACATEGVAKLAEAHHQASSPPCISDAARQTQVHESDYAIHRLMPRDRTIYFDVDRDSFRIGGVSDKVTDDVSASVEAIASYLRRQRLGINFAYRPSSDSPAVFHIRYDPTLGPRTLAKSFFPSDPRTDWKLGISKTVVDSSRYRYYLPNILGHELGHILGLRHWNARTHEAERSFHWPNTERECSKSIMVTGADPEYMLFSEEDFRVIREMYSLPNGYVLAGREIIDILP